MKNEIIINGVKYLRADVDKKVVTELTDEQVKELRGLILDFAAIVACALVVINDEPPA